MSARARSMEYLRGLSTNPSFVACAEHWNPFAHKRQDLFGFADLVWLDMEHNQIVAVQVVNTHLQDHVDKINQSEAARAWRSCGGRIEIHDWKKTAGVKKDGSRSKVKTWTMTIVRFQ